MDGKQLKAWRKSLDLSQKEAAEALGLKRRIFQYYEKGERDGEAIKPPKTVRLACWALTQGVVDYLGPEPPEKKDDKKARPKKAAKPGSTAPEAPAEAASPLVAPFASPVEDMGGIAPVPVPIEPAPAAAPAPRPAPARKPRAPRKPKAE